MSERHDIEETLRRFHHDTRVRAKDAVMSSYRRAFSAAGGQTGRAGFWRRPVPLYAAAVAVVVMVGLSFVAGRHVSATGEGQAVSPSVPASADIGWSPAERDLL